MIESPVVPTDSAQLQAFLSEYLGKIAETFQTIGSGYAYPHSATLPKQQYWDDYVSSFAAGKAVGVNVPSYTTFRNGIQAYEFSATAMQELHLEPIHLTHTIQPGSKIYPHVHWSTLGTNTGVVRWGIEYTIAKGHQQESFPASQTIYIEQAATGTPYMHMVAEVAEAAAINTSIEPDSLLMMRIFRDAAHANDTCTDKAFGFMCDLHYQKSFWATKNKSPNFYL